MRKGHLAFGTLVIAVATLIIAAVAIGLLISTAAALQSKGQDIGKKTTSEVGSGLMPLELYATDGLANGYLNYFYYKVKLTPNSEPIKLEKMLIVLGTENETQEYTYSGTINCSIEAAGSSESIYNDTAFSTNYGVRTLIYATNPIAGYINKGDVVELCFYAPEDVYETYVLNLKLIPEIGYGMTIEPTVYGPLNKKRITMFPYITRKLN